MCDVSAERLEWSRSSTVLQIVVISIIEHFPRAGLGRVRGECFGHILTDLVVLALKVDTAPFLELENRGAKIVNFFGSLFKSSRNVEVVGGIQKSP